MTNSRYDEFDTGNYNDICKAYFIWAMRNAGVDEDKIDVVLEEFKWLLDTVSAEEITK